MSATVSWLLPVKNGMPYLRETLDSLARQTFRDFVVLAWDNGSTDGSVEELRRWIPSLLPGRLVTDQALAYPASLAALVELAESPFCARIDADDICEPHRLATQVAALRADDRLLLVGSQILPMDEAGRPALLDYALPEDYTEILHRLFETNCISHPSVMFRREAVLAAGNYRLPAPVEDYDLWLRIAARGRIRNLREPLLRYRIRADSVTHLALKAQTLEHALDEAWLRNAALFCGLPNASSAERLRRGQLRFALPRFWQVARVFQERDGVPPLRRFQVTSFRQSCRHQVSEHDIGTKAFLKLFDPSTFRVRS